MEMNAVRCLRYDRSKWDDETYPRAEYRSLLVLLDEIYLSFGPVYDAGFEFTI